MDAIAAIADMRVWGYTVVMENFLEFQDTTKAGIQIVSLSGRLEAGSAQSFEDHITSLTGSGNRKILVDLSGLEYLSSAGLRSMLSLARILSSLDGKLAVCSAKGIVKEVFTISGFAAAMNLMESQEEAVESF